MSVYFIAFVQKVHDAAGQAEYGKLAIESLATSKATFHAAAFDRAGESGRVYELNPTLNDLGPKQISTLEGDLVDGVSLLSFPDRQALDEWYHGEAYQAALKIRQRSADTQVIVVDGLG